MSVVGHEIVRHRLAHSTPPVVLLEGPAGVGKRLVAREVAERVADEHSRFEVGVDVCHKMLDGMDHRHPSPACYRASIRVADYLKTRCASRTDGRAVVFDVDQLPSATANFLLKLLEEPPENTYFVMYASQPPPLTLASRAERIRLQPLSDDEMREVLKPWRIPAERFEDVLRLAAGRPGRAREVDGALQFKGVVQTFLKAAEGQDRTLLSQTVRAMRPANEQEWAEVKSTGDTVRGQHVVNLLRQALVEDRVRGVSFPPRVLDAAIARLSRGIRAEIALRSVGEMLMLSRT